METDDRARRMNRTPIYRPDRGCGCPGPEVRGASAHERNHGAPWEFTDRDPDEDGRRWAEAVAGGRELRERAADRSAVVYLTSKETGAWPTEIAFGIRLAR